MDRTGPEEWGVPMTPPSGREKRPAHRPTKFDLRRHPAWAQGLARIGNTDKDIAREFGISRSTLGEWKKKYPELSVATSIGRSEANMAVLNALHRRACGFAYTEKKVVQLPDGEKRLEITEKEVVPDPGAIRLWGINFMREIFSDTSRHEVTGRDGAPVPVEAIITSPEWLRIRSAFLRVLQPYPAIRSQLVLELSKITGESGGNDGND